MDQTAQSTATLAPKQIAGIVFCRALTPAWVLTGAIFKLSEADPKLLPRNIWSTAFDMGVDLYWLLAILVAIEIALAGIMVLMPKLARPAAIFTLSVFVLVLIGELAAGNKQCGCLGALSPPPWLMLTIDGALLVGCIAFNPVRRADMPLLPSGPATVATLWILAGIAVSAVTILPQGVAPSEQGANPPPVAITDGNGAQPDQSDQTAPTPTKPPGTYVTHPDEWVGKRFEDLDIYQWVRGWPENLDEGQQYVIFYSRSCDHCQELFEVHFYQPVVPTTIVAIPEKKRGFDTDAELPMNCRDCTELELPIGTTWMTSPPLVVALNNGVVECATEAEDIYEPKCLLWHPSFGP